MVRIIDAFFCLLSTIARRGREQVLKDVPDRESARALFESVLPESILGTLSPESFKEMRENLLQRGPKKGSLVTVSELRAGLYVFALVFLTTCPIALPFLVMHAALAALRVSNLIATILLFSVGFSLGRFAGRRALLWGVVTAILVSISIALGG